MRDHRETLALELVEHHRSPFTVPARHDGGPAFHGIGKLDYACGRCARLLAIGVRPGVFARLVFGCACGAMNRVPVRPALVALGRAGCPVQGGVLCGG